MCAWISSLPRPSDQVIWLVKLEIHIPDTDTKVPILDTKPRFMNPYKQNGMAVFRLFPAVLKWRLTTQNWELINSGRCWWFCCWLKIRKSKEDMDFGYIPCWKICSSWASLCSGKEVSFQNSNSNSKILSCPLIITIKTEIFLRSHQKIFRFNYYDFNRQ